MNRKLFQLSCVLLLLASVSVGAKKITAQAGSLSGIAYHVPIEGVEEVKDGHIVSLISGIYQLSSIINDDQIYGVVTLEPGLEVKTVASTIKTFPVLSSGDAQVIVNNSNGEIKKGDYVTSSETLGIGIKSTTDGYILGQALEDLNGETGKILVALHPSYPLIDSNTSPGQADNSPVSQIERAISSLFNFNNLSDYQTPDKTFRYLLALVIFISSLILASLSFGRTARSGIESIGRNPLASKAIILGIIFNVLVTIAIVIAGALISLYIIST